MTAPTPPTASKLTLARALLLDAIYQVLDNKVFRILAIVTVIMVLVPLMVAFRPDELVLLFGWRTFTYESFFDAMGPFLGTNQSLFGALEPGELHRLAVESYQNVIVTGVLGTFGMLICIAATAFFVPQMIEKGAADTMFSKPVSRLTLLLARYLTGVLFVAMLSGLLVGGTHLSLLVTSGIGDAAFLWTAVTLTYQFALIFGVTVVIAVFTRSTVASILLTLIFMLGNGCVHLFWQGIEMSKDADWREIAGSRGRQEASEGGVTVSVSGDETEDDDDEVTGFLGVLQDGLYVAHYTLPKTGDAEAIVDRLRSELSPVESEAYSDPEVELVVEALPPGFELLDSPASADDGIFHPVAEDDPIVLAAGPGGSVAEARLVIRRHPERQVPHGDSGRTRTESSRSAGEALEEWITSDDTRTLVQDLSTAYVANGTTWRALARELRFLAPRDGEDWEIRTLIVKEGDWIVTLQLQSKAGWLAEHPEVDSQFGGRDYRFGGTDSTSVQDVGDPESWYHSKLSWTGDWRFNIWFSIGSSLAFVVLCLAVGWLRLTRIDF